MHIPPDIGARLEKLTPTLRPLVQAMIWRIDLFADHGVPPDELVDSELAAEFRGLVEQLHSDPALRQEWAEFWLAFAAAYEEDEEEE